MVARIGDTTNCQPAREANHRLRRFDVEASSLASASYPIEVAWSLPDGAIESHLISPAGIARWTDWSAQAERLHGIRRAQLLAEGPALAWICRRTKQGESDMEQPRKEG